MSETTEAVLMLEDGTSLRGRSYGAQGETFGEAVFTTAMTGYQETLTDPSYHRQVVIQTSPHIGNTGMNDEDPESRQIWVSGYVVRDPAPRSSNWRSRRELVDDLESADVVGISGIDTRALTRHLRDRGAMRVGIFSGDRIADDSELLTRVQSSPEMAGANLTADVTTPEPYVVEPEGDPIGTVAAVDLGIKAMTPHRMAQRGLRVHVLPASMSSDELLAINADGYFLSNGPGDPAATGEYAVPVIQKLLEADMPLFGICLGHQMLALAAGAKTIKMHQGHRGANHPVQRVGEGWGETAGLVEITSMNHGFAVDADTLPETLEQTHVSLFDGSNCGIAVKGKRAFGVQYHPEASPGPQDSFYLFEKFVGGLV